MLRANSTSFSLKKCYLLPFHDQNIAALGCRWLLYVSILASPGIRDPRQSDRSPNSMSLRITEMKNKNTHATDGEITRNYCILNMAASIISDYFKGFL